ncbi:hypothetical protein ESA_03971 [Cronobacter sakazakii ATCC BAA-894]|uniref:Uncharacterized protein n=1 Tax=Cronobacter sakazakii (strain ATCC BAA-894) TaxID=290339 RepID=A7MN11_CROS8|nr:hypothetical protein ESA_03971 [Cronobacter sakazakii ATCC BAA-894]
MLTRRPLLAARQKGAFGCKATFSLASPERAGLPPPDRLLLTGFVSQKRSKLPLPVLQPQFAQRMTRQKCEY